MEDDRTEVNNRWSRGENLPPTYLPTFESIFRDRHLGSNHSVTSSQQVIQAEI